MPDTKLPIGVMLLAIVAATMLITATHAAGQTEKGTA
jgi:hypothetical protein